MVLLLTFKAKAQVGEYVGGMDFTIWINLKLKSNGTFEYHYITHSFRSIEDEGTWELRENSIILNSSKKARTKYHGKEIKKAKYLFRNFKYRLIDEKLIVNKKSKRASKWMLNFVLIKYKNE